MNFKYEKLGNLTKIVTGKLDVNAGDPDGKYPFFTCAEKPHKINQYAFDNEAVIVAGNGDLNVKYYKGKFNAYQRTYVIEITDENRINGRFLYYFLNGYLYSLRKQAIGGIIKYIKLNYLTDAKIPLPPLEEQIQIATVLSKAENLIAK
ncbi:MAG TPA: restriction endonuclease subunit S, partial [bacterium]|nr:restriction endonuclease subunit S [bacterium]